MKKHLSFVLFFLAVSFSGIAQNELRLHLAPRLGSAVFALDSSFQHPSGSYPLKYTRFEYYISEVIITHDGGQTTPATGLHLLVRAAQDSVYSLGQMPNVNKVEAITFSVGVEQAYNHLDPASFPPDDPLAPQNPEMHWGWVSGYRFAAVEGEAGPNLDQHFEIHSIGDANYFTQTITTVAEQASSDVKVIHLIADYAQAVKDIGLSIGLVKHGTTGAAVTLLANFRDVVFTALVASTVLDPAFTGTFTVSPSPVTTSEAPQVRFSLPEGEYTLAVTDITGRKLECRQILSGDNQSVALNRITETGLYFVHLLHGNRPVVAVKLVVTH